MSASEAAAAGAVWSSPPTRAKTSGVRRGPWRWPRPAVPTWRRCASVLASAVSPPRRRATACRSLRSRRSAAKKRAGQAWGLATIPSFHTHGTPPL